MNNIFSGSKPNLINENVLKTIELEITSNVNIPETTGEHLVKLYDKYIKHNLFAIMVILFIIIFLSIRYAIKKYNDKNNTSIEDNNKMNLNELESEIKNLENTINSDDIVNNQFDDDQFNNDNLSSEIITEEENFTNEQLDKYTLLNEEYDKMVKENNGLMSEQMMKDMYKKKLDKFSFDELTKIIVEGGDR